MTSITPIQASEYDHTCALRVEHLSVWLRERGSRRSAVRDLSFQIPAGGCTGIIGESGCGKSLTCQAILGLLDSRKWESAGSISLGAKNISLSDERSLRQIRGSKISLILQNPMSAFDPRMTIGAHFCEGLPRKLHKECLQEAEKRLEQMYIEHPASVLKSYSFQLSGGMLQRVLTALALSRRPDILIADEPTTALDATTQRELLLLLKKLQKEEGISILLVSHDLEVIRQMADQIIVMYAGEAAEYGPKDELLSHPLHPYTRGLFRSRPAFSRERLACMNGSPPGLSEPFMYSCPFFPRCERTPVHSGQQDCPYRQALSEMGPNHYCTCKEETYGADPGNPSFK